MAANIGETESLLNPAVPTVQEDTKSQRLLNLAHSVTQPQSPKGTEYALSGIAETMHEAIHGLDTAQKIGLDQKMRTDIEGIKAQRIKELESLKTNSAIAGGLGSQIPADTTKPIPNEVAQVGSKLEQLRDLRANGHISNTAYDGKLRMYLSDLRAQNPGYRDYIDDQGKKIIGYDPANKEIEQATADINALASNKMDERKFMMQQVAEHYSNETWAQGFIKRVMSGDPTANMVEFTRLKGPADLLKKEAEDAKNREVTDKLTVSNTIDRVGNAYVNHIFHNIAGPNLQTGDQVMKAVEDHFSGKKKLKPEEVEQMSANAQILLTNARSALNAWGAEPITMADGHVTTRRTALGDTLFEAKMNKLLEPLDNYIKLMGDEKVGPMHAQARMIKNIVESKQYNLLTDKDIGDTVAATKALEGYLPASAQAEVMKKLFANQKFDAGVSTFLALKSVNVALKEEPIAEVAQRLGMAGVTNREVYDTVINWVNQAKDPQMPEAARNQILANFADPRNQRLLSQIDGDVTTTGPDGRKLSVPVKYKYFFTLTDPSLAPVLSKAPTEIKIGYKDRVSEWFGITAAQDFKTLEGFESSGLSIKFDPETQRYLEIPVKTRLSAGEVQDVYANEVRAANAVIKKMNYMLTNYEAILKATDPSTTVTREVGMVLKSIGYDPNKPGALKAIGDAVKKMLTPRPSIEE